MRFALTIARLTRSSSAMPLSCAFSRAFARRFSSAAFCWELCLRSSGSGVSHFPIFQFGRLSIASFSFQIWLFRGFGVRRPRECIRSLMPLVVLIHGLPLNPRPHILGIHLPVQFHRARSHLIDVFLEG